MIHTLRSLLRLIVGPLASTSSRYRAVQIVLNGLSGPLTVNGKTYNSVMPPMSRLNDDELANILTFVTHSWNNKGPEAFSAAEIRTVRAATVRPPGAAE